MEAEGVIVGVIMLVVILFYLSVRFLRGRAVQRAQWLLKQKDPSPDMVDLTIQELQQIRSHEAGALRQALLGIQKRQREEKATINAVDSQTPRRLDSQTPRQPDDISPEEWGDHV